jgi:uncharacterized protein (PEP-CTERM system associated)
MAVLDPRALNMRVVVLAAVLSLARAGNVAAFPLIDPTNADQVPQGTELAAPDVNDLQHQLQLVNGLGAPAGGGVTFVPRLDLQEELTDNVLQQHSPRRWDLVTFISPGISLAGDLPRAQFTFDFAPTLSVYAHTGDLNSLTEQMNGLGTITLVPELAYVDVRALAGVQNLNGGIGGLGSVGAPAGAAATAQTVNPVLAGNNQGLNRDNEVQTSSFGISPYLLHRFGDWGTGKLGYSFDVTQSDSLSGFASLPFPTGGTNAQTLISNEEIAHFATGDILQFFQDSFDVDLQQGQTTNGAGTVNFQTGLPQQANQQSTSSRDTVTDQITYVVNRSLSVFASGGHEDITYSGFGAQSIHDLTWSLGGTITPNADSSLTVSYGHQNGFDSFSANGYYALTARTQLTVTYGSTLGTQLQNIQNQLNLATTNGSGTLVNAQTGGNQLFASNNALAVQNGVFRTDTLTVGSTTTLDRDIISLNLLLTKQTSSGNTVASNSQSKTANVNWLHQMRPDMTISAAFSYAIQDQTAGVISAVNPGNNTSIAASLVYQWQISETVTGSLQYSFFDRQATTSSATSNFDFYQNLIILGISKRF